MTKGDLVHTIRRLKGLEGNPSDFEVAILNEGGKNIGFLKPIDVQTAAQPEVLEYLTKWRRMFMRYFLTQFNPSVERTAEWLRRIVLPSDDRLIFLICDIDGRPVGNFGICNLSFREAELDNLIRGEKGGDAKLVYFSELSLLGWLFFELEIPVAVLHVFSNNQKTIALHQSVGFGVIKESPIWKRIVGEDVDYSVEENAGEKMNFKYLTMRLSRRDFNTLHPQISERKLLPI
jgi:RimJ/RimL family protein N-acetyltransferase